MKEFVEKLIGRLEELKSNPSEKTCRENILLAMQKNLTIYSAIEIVNQLAEEYGKDTNVTTNAERIRNMSDEELAEFLDDLTDNCCRCAEHQNCGNCQIGLDAKTGFCDIEKWLQSEVKGSDV